MKKFKVTFYTNLITASDTGESCQDWFTTECAGKDIESVSWDVRYILNNSDWIDNGENHFYKTSIITDFKIKEVKE
jgi:hypothetical protein